VALPHAAKDLIGGQFEPNQSAPRVPRRIRLDTLDPGDRLFVDRLVDLAIRGLPAMYRSSTREFAFTRAAAPDGAFELRGSSLRYGAIVALGAQFLSETAQRQVFGGRSAVEFIDLLVERLPDTANLGDTALVCWAAAQAGHPRLPSSINHLRRLAGGDGPHYVVEAAWVVSALVAAIGQVDVGHDLERATDRLMGSRLPGSPLFPHATAPGLLPWYRTHVACFADQVYPIQALARLHRRVGNGEALAAAQECAARICGLQGADGQWWWHYDARTGGVIEGYPVYTVHQHAMAPMALLDLAEAGGGDNNAATRLGLRWLADTPELGGGEHLILDDAALTWRKVYRGDPRKVVRAARGLTTRVIARARLGAVERLYRPTAVDRECRPYELGWLLFAWLGGLDTAVQATGHQPDAQRRRPEQKDAQRRRPEPQP
jgi:hypothetical protein